MGQLELPLKLFIVTKTESGWGWSQVKWVKYIVSTDIKIVRAVIRDRYGSLDQYHYDEEETHITIEEAEVETILALPRKRDEEDDY